MSKKIKFTSDFPSLDIPHPIPADRLLPGWYKKMPRVADDANPTVKTCMPFVDAMTTGYVITLPVDVHVREDGEIFANSDIMLLSEHYQSQIGHMSIDDSWDTKPYKWINNWYIKTPKGYSCTFSHPHNRADLPFLSLSGVVDTDKHPMIINFPFLLKKGWHGTIPAGTPLIQIQPFKREEWKQETVDDREPKRYVRRYELMMPPFNWYKRNWWSRKVYK